jgi:hypothetical protein
MALWLVPMQLNEEVAPVFEGGLAAMYRLFAVFVFTNVTTLLMAVTTQVPNYCCPFSNKPPGDLYKG